MQLMIELTRDGWSGSEGESGREKDERDRQRKRKGIACGCARVSAWPSRPELTSADGPQSSCEADDELLLSASVVVAVVVVPKSEPHDQGKLAAAQMAQLLESGCENNWQASARLRNEMPLKSGWRRTCAAPRRRAVWRGLLAVYLLCAR
jgi:hypothetical protein